MTDHSDFVTIWQDVLETIRKKIGDTSFDIWFSSVNFKSLRSNKVYISVPNTLTKEWIESRYGELIQDILVQLTNQNISCVFDIESAFNKEGFFKQLNPKYTFESFVVGESNRFAHAASFAVSEAPARAYNPLFIYGGVGLGKTHLMQAIAHHVLKQNPSCTVMYVSSEQFTNDMISSIKDDKTSAFRKKYRHIDILLIDDIQFLAGKERTQEEFFHTFNTLYESNKQVVISSDRPPKNIPTLEDRLRSRFEWGLITDIQAPDLETRTAILRKKAQTENLDMGYDVIDFISKNIKSNIRELEGALVRVVAYATITNKPLNMNTANEALKDVFSLLDQPDITIEYIQGMVAEKFSINITELLSKKRNKQLVYPRQIAMYLCRKYTDASYPEIGLKFGGRDHTTVMHATEKIEKAHLADPSLSDIITDLSKQINPYIS